MPQVVAIAFMVTASICRVQCATGSAAATTATATAAAAVPATAAPAAALLFDREPERRRDVRLGEPQDRAAEQRGRQRPVPGDGVALRVAALGAPAIDDRLAMAGGHRAA